MDNSGGTLSEKLATQASSLRRLLWWHQVPLWQRLQFYHALTTLNNRLGRVYPNASLVGGAQRQLWSLVAQVTNLNGAQFTVQSQICSGHLRISWDISC